MKTVAHHQCRWCPQIQHPGQGACFANTDILPYPTQVSTLHPMQPDGPMERHKQGMRQGTMASAPALGGILPLTKEVLFLIITTHKKTGRAMLDQPRNPLGPALLDTILPGSPLPTHAPRATMWYTLPICGGFISIMANQSLRTAKRVNCSPIVAAIQRYTATRHGSSIPLVANRNMTALLHCNCPHDRGSFCGFPASLHSCFLCCS